MTRTMSTFGTDPLVDFVNSFCKKVDFCPDFYMTLVASWWGNYHQNLVIRLGRSGSSLLPSLTLATSGEQSVQTFDDH